MGMSILYAVWIFVGIYGVTSQGDSLRSALNAVDRRQKYLFTNYPDVFFTRENSNSELNYLPDSISAGGNELSDYLSDGDIELGKQISSPFRERLEEDREKQLEELSQRFLLNLQSDGPYNFDYHSKDPWQKYRNNPHGGNDRVSYRKRQFYPDFGYDSIGLRKRNQMSSSEYPNDPNYYTNINEDYPSNDYIDTYEYSKRSSPNLERRYERSHPYWSFKHIPVAKRSSDYISKDMRKAQTDPKVEKDLSSIFEGTKVERNTTKKNETKEKVEVTAKPTPSEKPIQITKKSIDWSEYFGLDRRKKSQGINKEWLMDRYHKAVSKKNSEPPNQISHNHDGSKSVKKNKVEFDDSKLENMDRKLKSLEDDIVDDALRYTGANEGVIDPKEIQEVKDGIITRLAKAYSIEKMRRALGEYKMLVDREREKLSINESDDADEETYEEKRVSVPRKQAVDPNKEVQIEDNHIKCTHGSDDCDEENYRAPIEVIEQMNYEVGGCPKIQRDCNEVAPLLGQYSKIFEEACSIHQMCLLCGNNSWYPATRQCNILFLSKVSDMCDGKTDCQKELQKSVRYLMNINKNLRSNPTGECDLVCPENTDAL